MLMYTSRNPYIDPRARTRPQAVPRTRDARTGWIFGALIFGTELTFAALTYDRGPILLIASALMTAALWVQFLVALPACTATPAAHVVLIFNWLFLDAAPKIQLIANGHQLVNTSSLQTSRAAETFLVCAGFTMLYSMVVYLALQGMLQYRGSLERRYPVAPRAEPRGLAAISLVIVAFVAMVAGLVASRKFGGVAGQVGIADLLIRKFVLLVPSMAFMVLLDETIRAPGEKKFSRYAALGFLLLLTLLTENPITEKRNGLGTVYLSILLIAFQIRFRSQFLRFGLLMGGMAIAFPVAALFTHRHGGGGLIDGNALLTAISEHYLSTHYDAWANVYTSLEMAERHGVEFGRQALGAILFFVPSSIWVDKPQASGIFIGDYLAAHYAMWFNNLSAPLVAEGILDFGPFGWIPYAVLLGLCVLWLERRADSQSVGSFPMLVYFSVFLMFLLRGSLMIAVAYGAGSLCAFMVVRAVFAMSSRLSPAPRRSFAREPAGAAS